MRETQTDMRTKNIWQLLISMSVPMVLSMTIQALYNIVDSIYVTRLGTDALTAVSLAFPLQNAVLSLSVGMGVAICSLVSMKLGAGDRNEASKTATLGCALVLVHCLIFFLAGIFITKPFLRLFTDDEHIFSMACDYARMVLCCSFGQLIQIALEKVLQSVGKMKTTMYLLATGALINIILDPILIFGYFGFPAMGVKGAAIATVIGQVTAMALYVVIFKKYDVGVSLGVSYLKFDKSLVKRLYSIAVPSTLMLAMPSLLIGVLNGILTGLGTVYVAVFGLYFKLQTFIYLPASGVVQGMRPIVSYNYGAGDLKRVHETMRHSMEIVFGIMIFGTIAAVGFPGIILKIFDADAELMKAGISALRIIGTGFCISAVAVVGCGVFEAIGKGKDSLIISLLRQFVIIVPLGFVLSRFLGANGIWLSFPIAETIALLVAVIKLKKNIN